MKKLLVLLVSLIPFTDKAAAQSVCDSLDIQVGYAPFYDSLIEIRVWNNSAAFFNYPGFIMYNGAGDTVAKETLNLFGIAQSSVHGLNIYPGVITSPSFGGTLELYTHNFDTLSCSYPMNFDLCPDSCEQAIVYLGNMGGAGFIGTVNYDIKDSALQTVKSGVLTIGSSQYDADTTCLYPGHYSLHLSQIALTSGGAKYYGVTRDSATFAAPTWVHNQTNDTSFAFSFYSNCAALTAVRTIERRQEMAIVADGGKLHLLNRANRSIGKVMLYSIDGRIVSKYDLSNVSQVLDVSHLSSGIYIVEILKNGQQFRQKVFLGNK